MPHVTVLAELRGSLTDVTSIAGKLAARTGPLQTTLTTIEWTPGEYYRSFFALVAETEALAKLHRDTCEIAGECPRRPYHLSLMYTDRLSNAERAAIRDSIYQQRGGQGFGMELLLTRLQVCSSSGLPPEEWTCPVAIALH